METTEIIKINILLEGLFKLYLQANPTMNPSHQILDFVIENFRDHAFYMLHVEGFIDGPNYWETVSDEISDIVHDFYNLRKDYEEVTNRN